MIDKKLSVLSILSVFLFSCSSVDVSKISQEDLLNVAYEKESGIPVFVAFGIGGSPEKPKEVYFLKLDSLRYGFLKQSLVRSGKTAAQL